MDEIKRIPINIWDDYIEDGCLEENEIQETYMYVEDTDFPQIIRKKCLELILDYMEKYLKLDGVEFELFFYDSKIKYPTLDDAYQFERWQINFKHLTHERREKLVEELNYAEFQFMDNPFEIYSES